MNKKNILLSTWEKIKKIPIFNKWHIKNKNLKELLIWIISSIIINMIIIYLNPISYTNNDIVEYAGWIFIDNSFKLILNTLIFMLIGMFMLPSTKRYILFIIYSVVWIGLGLANNILMDIRNTNLTKYDFTMIFEGLELGKSFLKNSHYLKIIIFILFALISIIFISKKIKVTTKPNIKKIIPIWIIIVILNAITIKLASFSNAEYINNYAKFGFVYAFAENVITPDVLKPYTYNKSTIKKIKNEIDSKYRSTIQNEQPNIIAIQLESFFDIKTINGLNISENPTPYFDELCKNYTSGIAKVPTVGGGTARSEFEFITGLSLKYMKDGIIPHNTILKDEPYMSSIYAVRKNNYKTHFLHNFAGYYYNRDKVYNNLGFDTFTSLELLNNASNNPVVIKESRDNIFPQEIKNLLTSTESKDFIFAITTQLHGNYETNYTEFENNIRATGNFDSEQLSQMNDYVNEIKSIDNVIKDIIDTVNELNEPTIIIFYGDHIPPLSYKNTNIKNDNIYNVPYVVWDNINLKKEKMDVNLYELLSKYLYISGIEGTYINKLQVIDIDDEIKTHYQELIQYDITLGNNYIGEKYMPYKVNTQLGVNEIVIDSVEKEDITYTIKGSGFTSSMVLVVDDTECGIEYENPTTIKFTTNQDLTNKNIYFKIKIGQNTTNYKTSNILKVK